jgi:hypothetical protein
MTGASLSHLDPIRPGLAMPPKVRSDVVPALRRGLCRMYAYIRLSSDHTPRRGSLEAQDQ